MKGKYKLIQSNTEFEYFRNKGKLQRRNINGVSFELWKMYIPYQFYGCIQGILKIRAEMFLRKFTSANKNIQRSNMYYQEAKRKKKRKFY